MASIGDGMTQELKNAIKAKHKLVEQMKEEVVHPEDHKSNNMLWKIIIITSSILLLFLAVHQVRPATRDLPMHLLCVVQSVVVWCRSRSLCGPDLFHAVCACSSRARFVASERATAVCVREGGGLREVM